MSAASKKTVVDVRSSAGVFATQGPSSALLLTSDARSKNRTEMSSATVRGAWMDGKGSVTTGGEGVSGSWSSRSCTKLLITGRVGGCGESGLCSWPVVPAEPCCTSSGARGLTVGPAGSVPKASVAAQRCPDLVEILRGRVRGTQCSQRHCNDFCDLLVVQTTTTQNTPGN